MRRTIEMGVDGLITDRAATSTGRSGASEHAAFGKCGAEGTRTPDPLHAMEVRYQLRYSPGEHSCALRFAPTLADDEEIRHT